MALNFLNNGYFAGKVGIGSESPGAQLYLTSTNYEMLHLHQADANAGLIKFTNTDDASGWYTGIAGTEKFIISRTADNSIPIITVEQGGNVGIGATSPGQKLVVVGNIGTSGSVLFDDNQGINFGNSNAKINGSSSDGIKFFGSGSEKMRLTQAGNVGIGTTTPAGLLHLSSTSPSIYIEDTDATNTYNITTISGGNNLSFDTRRSSDGAFVSTDYQIVKDALGANYHRWFTQGSERMRITSAGNVGIGTTSPGAKLDVVVSNVSVTPNGNSSAVFRQNANNYISILSGTNNEGGVLFGNSNDAADGWIAYQNGSGNQFITFGTANSEKMRILSGGNVGIGTTSPTGYRLVVENASEDLLKLHNSTDGLDALISFTNPGGTLARIQGIDNGGLGFDVGNNAGGIISNAMFVKNNGKVGIGTTLPGDKLHVEGGIIIQNGNNLQWGGLYSAAAPTIYASTNYLAFVPTGNTGAATRGMHLTATGLGIGTSSPSAKLEVAGNTRLGSGTFHVSSDATLITSATYTFRDGVYINNPNSTAAAAASGNVMSIGASSGNAVFTSLITTGAIGIGKSNPSAQLDVVGTGNFTGLVSGITPVAAANFVTKAYADGLTPGTGVYLPLAGGTMTGNINFNNSVRELRWDHTSGQSGSRAYGFIGEQGAYGRFALRSSNAADNVLDTDVVYFDADLSATFAGDVLVEDNLYLTDAGTVRGKIQLNASDRDDLDIKAVSLGSNMKFFTVDTERMRITSDGYVGIGSTNPATKFVVQHTDGGSGIEFSMGANLNYIQSYNRATSDYIALKFDAEDIRFGTNNGSERMRIDSNGDVGIGTTTPFTKLEIKGTASTRNALSNILTINGGENVSNPYDGFGVGTVFRGRDYSNALRDYAYIYGVIQNQTSSSTPAGDPGFKSQLRFYTNTGGASATLPTQKMVITSAGNVGIGTGSPIHKLTVNGKIGGLTFSDSYLQFTNGNVILKANDDVIIGYSSSFYVKQNGNVGIGTTSPSSKLELGPNGSLGANITNKNVILNIDGGYGTTGTPSSGQYKVIGFTGTTKDVTDITGQNGGETSKNFYAGIIGGDYFNQNRFSIWQDGVERLTILGTATGSGNVGIGTSSPDGNLEVITSTIVSGASDTVNNVLIGLQSANRPTIILDTADTTYTNRSWNITNVGSAGKLFIGRNGLDVMVMDNSGKVGIGTAGPLEKLHVVGNVFLNANSAFKASYNNTDSYHGSMRWAGLQLGNNGVNRIAAGRTGVGGSFQFWTNNTNDVADYTVTPDGIMTMSMTNAGNVGIGTTTSNSKLTVMESTLCTNSGTDGGTSYVPAKPILLVTTDGNGTASGNYATNSVFTVGIGGGITGAVTTEHFRVNLNGKIGIGTETPDEKLDITGGYLKFNGGDYGLKSSASLTYSATNLQYFYTNGGTLALTLDSSQNATFTADITTDGSLNVNRLAGSTPYDNFKISTADIVTTLQRVENTADAANGYGRLDFKTNAAVGISGAAGRGGYKFIDGGNNNILYLENLDKSATFGGKAFGITPQTSDSSSMLATKGYVQDQIAGGANYLGTWDPDNSLNSGYGNPSLQASGRSDTSGDYFICSADGGAHPNGGACEPDTWHVGDWVVWNSEIVDCAGTGTGTWQKIDNTSVLSGIGTGQTVALWEGVNTVTDSESLGNSPITVNGNNVGIGVTLALNPLDVRGAGTVANFQSSSTYVDQKWTNSGATNYVNFTGSTFNLYNNGGSASNITLSISTTAATFSGNLIVPNGSITTIGGNNLTISGTVADHAGISFATNSILPCVIGAITNNIVDLGQNGNVYKDLYLGGSIIGNTGSFTGLVSGITPTANSNFTTKLYVDNKVAAGGGAISSANSLYDLIPNGAFTTTYAFTSTAGTYAEVMKGNDVITAAGTYSVQMTVNDYAVGGTQYDEKYSGVMSWHTTSTNDSGGGTISEILLHRAGHAANQGATYLRTREMPSPTGVTGYLKLEIMCNRTYTGASNVIFKFVRLI